MTNVLFSINLTLNISTDGNTYINAEATCNMWNDTDLSFPYPFTDKLAPSN